MIALEAHIFFLYRSCYMFYGMYLNTFQADNLNCTELITMITPIQLWNTTVYRAIPVMMYCVEVNIAPDIFQLRLEELTLLNLGIDPRLCAISPLHIVSKFGC